MTVLITLTIAGSSTGPFNLYSNIGNYATPFETNVPKASLVAGYLSTSVPAGTTTVQVRSLGTCTNSIDIPIDLLTTSTTSTTSTSTTSTSTTTVPTTTSTTSTTTTTIPILECVELTNDIVTTQQTCLGLPYDLKLGTITLDLVDSLGAPSIATNDVTVTLSFQTRQCGDSAPVPTTVPVTILTGTSSITHSYTREQTTDCGQGACEVEYDIFQSVVSVEPSLKYAMCNVGSSTTTTSTTTSSTTTTVAPTSTSTTTTTQPAFNITTTACPNTYHTVLNRIYFGVSGAFGNINLGSFETACWAASVVNAPNTAVYATAFSQAYWYDSTPNVGDGPFSSPDDSCLFAYPDGYYLMQIEGVYTVVQFMNNVIVDFPTCPSSATFIPPNWSLYNITQGYTTEALACAAYAFDGGQTGGVGIATTVYGPSSGIVNGAQIFNTNGTYFSANSALFYIITPYINLIPGLEGTCKMNMYGTISSVQPMNCMTINIT